MDYIRNFFMAKQYLCDRDPENRYKLISSTYYRIMPNNLDNETEQLVDQMRKNNISFKYSCENDQCSFPKVQITNNEDFKYIMCMIHENQKELLAHKMDYIIVQGTYFPVFVLENENPVHSNGDHYAAAILSAKIGCKLP